MLQSLITLAIFIPAVAVLPIALWIFRKAWEWRGGKNAHSPTRITLIKRDQLSVDVLSAKGNTKHVSKSTVMQMQMFGDAATFFTEPQSDIDARAVFSRLLSSDLTVTMQEHIVFAWLEQCIEPEARALEEKLRNPSTALITREQLIDVLRQRYPTQST